MSEKCEIGKHVCMFRAEPCDLLTVKVGFHKAQWPLCSDSAGVHPSQIPEAMEEARRLGTHIEYNNSGQAIFQSKRHRDEYTQKLRLVDRSREITMPKIRTMRERSDKPIRRGQPNDP